MMEPACKHQPFRRQSETLIPSAKQVLFIQCFPTMTTNKRSSPAQEDICPSPLKKPRLQAPLSPQDWPVSWWLYPQPIPFSAHAPCPHERSSFRTVTHTGFAVAQSFPVYSNGWARALKSPSFTSSANVAHFIPTRREQYWTCSTLNGPCYGSGQSSKQGEEVLDNRSSLVGGAP